MTQLNKKPTAAKAPIESLAPEADWEYFIREATRRIAGGRFGFILEAFQNSLVAGATLFDIYVEGSGNTASITFTDNGQGMGKRGRQAYTDLGKSPYRNDPTKRSKHGYGRFAGAAKYDHVKVFDCSKELQDSGMMRVMEFDWTRLFNAYGKQEAQGKRVDVFEEAHNPTYLRLPNGSPTGARIELSIPREKVERFSPTTLINNLGEGLRLPPWQTAQIRVFDGKELRPLKVREMIGNEVLNWEEPRSGQLGKSVINIYLPTKPSDKEDLWVGTVAETICPFSEFIKDIPEKLWDSSLDILLNPMVKGHIHFEGFMAYRAGDSSGFTEELYTSLKLEEALRYLKVHVVPPVQEKLEVNVVSDESKSEQNLREDLQNLISGIGGKKKEPETQVRRLDVYPRNVELVCGDSVELEVTRKHPDIKKVAWDASKCQGKITPAKGFKTKYTAPSSVDMVGRYEIIAFDEDDPKTRDVVVISVYDQLCLRIRPSNLTIRPNHQVKLSAVNWENMTDSAKECKDIVWRLDPHDAEGGFVVRELKKEKIKNIAYGPEVIYQSGSIKDAFTIEASIANRRDRKNCVATCNLIVEDKSPGTVDPSHSPGDTTVEGIAYKLAFGNFPVNSSMAWIHVSPGGRATVHFNMAHAGFQRVKGSRTACAELAFNRFLLEHQARNKGFPMEICHDFDALHKKAAEGQKEE